MIADLFSLLLLVVAISAFMGYRSYKAKKSLQLQPVLQSSSAIISRDETEDLV
ncbi:hypothetical protein [Candidatus Ichthyocystis sparus]|uniref:hypothetical protein n=1 Tax=Candidatus Ichthyocystis sparus TaxID=1561004 RepID=UPI00159EE487|nr:hypothetical protein [Candidatus Ichthyocystis sparus]